MTINKKVNLIVDGNNLVFRMAMSLSLSHVNKEVGGLYGVLNSVKSWRFKFSVDSIYFVFDGGLNPKRVQLYPKYKQRDKKTLPQETLDYVYEQIDLSYNFVRHIYPTFKFYQVEADDIVATLTDIVQPSIIISTDSDFLQLITDDIMVFNPTKKVVLDTKTCLGIVGVTPAQIPLFKSYTGDNSDNISGIKGIGPKRAAKLLNNPDNVIETEHKDVIERNLQLITLEPVNDIKLKIKGILKDFVPNQDIQSMLDFYGIQSISPEDLL